MVLDWCWGGVWWFWDNVVVLGWCVAVLCDGVEVLLGQCWGSVWWSCSDV